MKIGFKKVRNCVSLSFVLAGLAGCGNTLLVGSADKDTENARLQQALSEWDSGNVEGAVTIADKLLAENPYHEDAAILRANLYLAESGVTPFDLTLKMINNDSASSETDDVLGGLSSLVEITDEEYKKLGTTTTSTSGETNTVFSDIPVFQPAAPGSVDTADSPRSSVAILKNLSFLIKTICPFVTPSIRKSDPDQATTTGYDARHVCDSAKTELKSTGKSNFVFAIAHLLEALVYNQVVLDTGAGEFQSTALNLAASSETSALTKRGDKLKDIEPLDDPDKYIASVKELQDNFTKVFSSDTTSMFATLMLNMRIVSESFGAIAGIPDSIISKITGSFDKIKASAEAIPGVDESAAGNVDNQIKGLQQQMNESTSKTLKSELDNLGSEQVPAGEEENFNKTKTSLCGALDDFSKGTVTSDTCTE